MIPHPKKESHTGARCIADQLKMCTVRMLLLRDSPSISLKSFRCSDMANTPVLEVGDTCMSRATQADLICTSLHARAQLAHSGRCFSSQHKRWGSTGKWGHTFVCIHASTLKRRWQGSSRKSVWRRAQVGAIGHEQHQYPGILACLVGARYVQRNSAVCVEPKCAVH